MNHQPIENKLGIPAEAPATLGRRRKRRRPAPVERPAIATKEHTAPEVK